VVDALVVEVGHHSMTFPAIVDRLAGRDVGAALPTGAVDSPP